MKKILVLVFWFFCSFWTWFCRNTQNSWLEDRVIDDQVSIWQGQVYYNGNVMDWVDASTFMKIDEIEYMTSAKRNPTNLPSVYRDEKHIIIQWEVIEDIDINTFDYVIDWDRGFFKLYVWDNDKTIGVFNTPGTMSLWLKIPATLY